MDTLKKDYFIYSLRMNLDGMYGYEALLLEVEGVGYGFWGHFGENDYQYASNDFSWGIYSRYHLFKKEPLRVLESEEKELIDHFVSKIPSENMNVFDPNAFAPQELYAILEYFQPLPIILPAENTKALF